MDQSELGDDASKDNYIMERDVAMLVQDRRTNIGNEEPDDFLLVAMSNTTEQTHSACQILKFIKV